MIDSSIVDTQRHIVSSFDDTRREYFLFLTGGIVLAVVVTLGVVCFCCQNRHRKTLGKEAISDWREMIRITREPQPELPVQQNQPLPANTFSAVQEQPLADGPTIERFFHELDQDKPVRFSAQQLNTFTQNYSRVLGSGGCGKVYWGQLPNGVTVAVKTLYRGANGPARIEQQFMAEVGTIGRTNHFNLVRLYGFCYDQEMSALVYEFMENGSLDRHLFKQPSQSQLTWEKLHEIAVGVAKGIAYLHHECQQRIIHYDIKPGNVLLDINFNPKVADFGLAKLCARDASHITDNSYRGTPGYSAPECMQRDFPITNKIDVYSFGMLLFEIIARRRNANDGINNNNGYWHPRHLWEEYEKGKLNELLETSGIEKKHQEQATRMALGALWCIQHSPDQRPQMSTVVKILEGGLEIMPPPKPFNHFSVPQINLSTFNF